MRLAAHQPTFMPYLGFWAKAMVSDLFVLLPSYQFSRGDAGSFMHRCLMGHDEEKAYLSLPIANYRFPSAINEVRLDERRMDDAWRSLEEKHASLPFWKDVATAVRPAWERRHETLASMNIDLILSIASIIGIEKRFIVKDGMPPGACATSKLQSLCEEFGASVYVSGSGGRAYMDMSKMKIPTAFSEPILPAPYKTVSVVSVLSEIGTPGTCSMLMSAAKCLD